MTAETRTDLDITTNVIAVLTSDPAVTCADLDITTSHGYVTLSGTTTTWASKYAAEDATCRVLGVRGITNNIRVNPSGFRGRGDADIRSDVERALFLDNSVPFDNLAVAVNEGLVTLKGRLDSSYQRDAAEDSAARIAGVTGVVNLIMVEAPPAMADDISNRIGSAFARSSELADDRVLVTVEGSTATLSGSVRTWREYEQAERAAWRAPGVTCVINTMAVTS